MALTGSRRRPGRRKLHGAPASQARTFDELLSSGGWALEPITSTDTTGFSSVASTFEFRHHVGTDPANELVVLKRILVRECLLSRLETTCSELRKQYRRHARVDGATGSFNESNEGIIRMLSQIRDATVAVVEAVLVWRRDASKSSSQPFIWHGQNYLLKLTNDLNFLAGVEPLVVALKV